MNLGILPIARGHDGGQETLGSRDTPRGWSWNLDFLFLVLYTRLRVVV